MRTLINFLLRHNYLSLFVLLELISLALLIRFNNYQQGVFFTSANVVIGKVQEIDDRVTQYVGLREENQELAEHNIQLTQEISALRKRLTAIHDKEPAPSIPLQLVKASVINNSIWESNNYITLNKGERDGVRVGQGVMSYLGVAGIVYMTSSHYSVVLSLLHTKTRLSCKLETADYFGTLLWDGRDPHYMYLEGIPHHAKWKRGDRIVTSGYSDVFPAGLTVGTIVEANTAEDGLAYRMRIKLATNFSRLTNAYAIKGQGNSEQTTLEKRVVEEDQQQ